MALSDFDGLKQAVIDHLERSDLTDQVEDFIAIAESRHKDDLRFREIEKHDQAFAIAQDDRYLDLPTSDFNDLKYLRIQNPAAASGGRRYLSGIDEITLDQITDKSVNHRMCPRWFAVHDDHIELHAPADQAYTAELFYYITVTPLSASNDSNEILVRTPDAYLYGALAASAPFLMHDERVNTWETLYNNAVARVNGASVRNTRSGPLTARTRNRMR